MWAGVAEAQTPDPYAAARAAMEGSVRQQDAAVARQRESVRAQAPVPPQDGFFTVPWSSPAPVLAATEPSGAPECEPISEEEAGPLIEEMSQREGLTPDLLRAIIRRESAFLPCAVSRKGAQGLMQLMPETAMRLGVRNPFDPRENVEGGARFLRQLLKKYGGDLALALGAYNAGPARVDARGGVPQFPETLEYVSDILGQVGRSLRNAAAESDPAWPPPPQLPTPVSRPQ